MQNWTVRQRIAWSFGAVVALLLVTGAFAFTRLDVIEQEATRVQKDSVRGLYQSGEIMVHWLDVFSLAERHALSADRAEKQRVAALIEAKEVALDAAVKQYEELVTTAKERQALDAFKSARASYTRLQEEL